MRNSKWNVFQSSNLTIKQKKEKYVDETQNNVLTMVKQRHGGERADPQADPPPKAGTPPNPLKKKK